MRAWPRPCYEVSVPCYEQFSHSLPHLCSDAVDNYCDLTQQGVRLLAFLAEFILLCNAFSFIWFLNDVLTSIFMLTHVKLVSID